MEMFDTSRCDVLKAALAENLISEAEPSAQFFDTDYFDKVLTKFRESFPSNVNFLHCFAVKAAPFPKLVKRLPDLNFGAEAASLTEVEISLRNGVKPQNIIWDSPCKTVEEIKFALEKGVNMNADNFQELTRINDAIKELSSSQSEFPKFLGFRINPCVGFGARAVTSTSDINSKFGVPIDLYKDEIIKAFETYGWLNTLHIHIGSQAFGIGGLVEAIEKICTFAEEINVKKDKQKIIAIDIGGGLPARYDDDDYTKHLESFPEFVDKIKEKSPVLFSGKYTILSESGRTFATKCGFSAARIEYTKKVNDLLIVTQHLGADLLMRTCYLPTDWPLRMFVCNPDGSVKTTEQDGNSKVVCDVAGPLCFGGDKIARGRTLINPQPGDWLVVCDTGGYTLGMWSRHCSRPIPSLFEFQRGEQGVAFGVMKKKETIDQVIAFYE